MDNTLAGETLNKEETIISEREKLIAKIRKAVKAKPD